VPELFRQYKLPDVWYIAELSELAFKFDKTTPFNSVAWFSLNSKSALTLIAAVVILVPLFV
jgi:hypothetical protein